MSGVEITGAELLPCPFCGSPAEIEEGSDHHGTWFNLGCSRHWGHVRNPDSGNTCIAGRMYYTETEVPILEAVASWNTRQSATAPLIAALEEAREAFNYCKHEAYCSVDAEIGSVDRFGYGRIENRARAALTHITETLAKHRGNDHD
jgi:hypothetical protein